MSKSYKKVNYLLRLKKQIERKLIIETLHTISNIIKISDYHYLGFGSVYFADFILFHKYLNIINMTSIEKEEADERRFLFNKPFDFICFQISECNHFLRRELNWEDKLLIWLDYDNDIDIEVIGAVEFIASKAKPFDILLVTIEAESPSDLTNFINEFKEYIPSTLNRSAIKKRFSETLNGVMKSIVQNGLRFQVNNLDFLQLFNLTYRDTRKMYTFGGIFCEEKESAELKKQVSALNYIEHGERVVQINCPFVTPKEKIHLDSLVHGDGIRCEDTVIGLSYQDIEEYGKYYKYYPQFFESIY
jgi:hypothetical protein